MVLSSKLDFNLTLETANSNFLENIFCAIETNVPCNNAFTPFLLILDLGWASKLTAAAALKMC